MSRTRVVVVHAVASVLLAALAGWMVVTVFYPFGLLSAMGAQRAALVCLAMFFVLGPGLSVLLYRPGKRGLAVDVALILLLQLGAGVAGAFVLWQGRPAFLVFAVDRVTAIGANDLSDDDLEHASEPAFARRPVWGPVFVAIDPPTDAEQQNTILFSSIESGKDIDRFPHFYAPVSRHVDEVATAARAIAGLAGRAGRVSPFASDAALGYLPLVARDRDQALVISRRDATIRGVIDAEPW